MYSKIGKVIRFFTSVLMYGIIILALALVGMRFAGIKQYVVTSGSMVPTYPVGSFIFVKSVEPETLEVGDVITFTMGANALVTHRIIQKNIEDDGSLSFNTKGDANGVADSGSIAAANIVGKVIYNTASLGNIYKIFGTPSGKIALIVLALSLLLIVIMQELYFPEQPKVKKRKQTAEAEVETEAEIYR